jgi:hypothetical protein
LFKNAKLIVLFEIILIIGFAHGDSAISKNKSEHNKTKITKENNETILGKMGISYENQKIIIDLNKSTHFFLDIGKALEVKAKNFSEEIKKSDIFMDINKSIN